MATQITLIGNATGEPELSIGPSGDARASFRLGVDEWVKKDNEWVKGDSAFYQITAWGNTGEAVAEQVRKGMKLVVLGKFKPREYETKTGEKRISLDVTADVVGIIVKPAPVHHSQGSRDDEWTKESVPF